MRIETHILRAYNLFEINSKGGFIMTGHDLARMLDGTITATGVTRDEMVHFIQKAKEKEFYSIISSRCYLPYLIEQLQGSKTIPGSGCCLSSGADATPVKAYAAAYTVSLGAKEVDIVMNINYFKSHMYREVIQDIRAVKESIGAIPLKCIIEASILSDNEIQTACELVVEGGADFLKTGTGDEGPTTLHHIDLIAKTLRGRAKIKAAGGIRTPETVEQFVNAGVERFGIGHKSVFHLLDAMDAR